jgi:CheY-like chemotaxis protein
MGVTPRYVRELQGKAVHVLARAMLARAGEEGLSTAGNRPRSGEGSRRLPEPNADRVEWTVQVREEILSLHRSAPDALAEIAVVLDGAAALARTLTAGRGIRVAVDAVPCDLAATIHPSVLRQAVLASIEALAEGMASGTLLLGGQRERGSVTVTVAQRPAGEDRAYDVPLVREVVALHHGSLELGVEGDSRCLRMILPEVSWREETTVLVIDDNADLVSFYEAYAGGTRYKIVHVARGKDAFQAIEVNSPAIIVLDVMLPDVDGWELLVQLHGHPATRTIPVVVCSVIRDRELAAALGAAVYLPKPVRRRQFLHALDQALNQAASGGSRDVPNSAAVC